MKKAILASLIGVTVLGLSSASFALGGKENMLKQFGEVYEMKVGDHMMHMQLIQDANGGQWVVMSREEAETLLGGSLGSHKFTVLN